MSAKHPPVRSPVSEKQRKKIKTGGSSGLELDPEMDTSNIAQSQSQPQDKIIQLLEKMSLDISAINERFTALDNKYMEVTTKLVAAEERISTLEDKINCVMNENAKLTNALDSALIKVSEMENQSRRRNLRIHGFPEECERGRPTEFLEKELPKILDLPPGSIDIERAHRSLNPRPQPGQRPRPFVVNLLRFPIKEKILSIAREKKELKWGPDNGKIMIFQDFSKDVMDKRQKFMEAKRMARSKNLEYFMSYPAVLKIKVDNRLHSFSTHQTAEHFISTY